MGGHAAEQQIVAGVVLSERLAVTMYGAIHRAQFNGARNLRGLVVDPKMLAEGSFRIALSDQKRLTPALALTHENIVPTLSVEEGGAEVVVVTRGVGRFVTVQDLIVAARANRRDGGKLPLPVAAAIAKSVVGALAVAHKAGVVHGAVHPRSVLVDEDGAIRLGDFVVGRALTTAVAQGADSALWRGLAGYLAPELVVGDLPTPSCDVFACGAMLFTMLSGEVPPGTLHVTPAVERLVQRALDADVVRRYKNAADLLENILEAFEDDRWEVAERGEIIRAAGLSSTDTSVDEATEDLLASLGSSAVQVTPMRPSMELRAESVAARHHTKTPTGANRLEALMADLGNSDHTQVNDSPAFRRDPISEIIQQNPRKKEAIIQIKSSRVPSLDDPDDTPLPPPRRIEADSDDDVPRPNVRDEDAAMDAIMGIRGDRPVQRMSSAAEQAEQAAAKLEQAAARAEAAADVVVKSAPRPVVVSPARATPIVEAPDFVLPPAKIKSKTGPIIGIITILAMVGIGVFVYKQQADAADKRKEEEEKNEAEKKEREELEARLRAAASDTGTIEIESNPTQAGVWLRLGPTPVDTMQLDAGKTHEIAVLLEGYQLGEIQVVGADWNGTGDKQRADIKIDLRKLEPDKKTKQIIPAELPLQSARAQENTARVGGGKLKIQSTPRDAEAYLFLGITGMGAKMTKLTAGREYEFVLVKPGYRTRKVIIKPDDWRDDPDTSKSLDVAKKKTVVKRTAELEELPKDAKPDDKKKPEK